EKSLFMESTHSRQQFSIDCGLQSVHSRPYDLDGPLKTGLTFAAWSRCLAERSKRHKVYRASFAAALPSLFFHRARAIATTRVTLKTSRSILHSSLSVLRLWRSVLSFSRPIHEGPSRSETAPYLENAPVSHLRT